MNGFGHFARGIMIGVAVGLLFAPRRGADTRKKIARKVSDGQDYVRKRGAEMYSDLSDAVDDAQKTIQKTADGMIAASEAARRTLKTAVNQL